MKRRRERNHESKKGPSASLYTSSGHRKYLNGPERQRFIAAAQACPRGELRTLALVLAHTGVRISEALALTVGAIQQDAGFIAVRSLKKRGVLAVREIPVPSDLLLAIERQHRLSRRQPCERLWTFSRSRAWQLVKALMRGVGIAGGPHATPKGLRHGYGVHAIRSGVPINLVQRWLGHASMTTTAIYLQALGEDERDIAARMWTDAPTNPAVALPSVLRPAQGGFFDVFSSALRLCPVLQPDTTGLHSWNLTVPGADGSTGGPIHSLALPCCPYRLCSRDPAPGQRS